MSSNTLDELAREALETIAGERTGDEPATDGRVTADEPGVDERVTADTIASELEAPREAVEERLAQLVDNALVREANGAYELTENGRRVLAATPVGAADDRIDTPPAVGSAIEDLSLRPDEEAAVRSAVSFLRYWGEATTAELVDAAYSEVPAGYETADRWWTDCVGDALATLPDVRRPEPAGGSSPERWRYEGESVVERPPDRDGRAVGDERSDPSSFGSVRHGIERLATGEDERAAARAAFAVLFDRRRASAADLVEAVYGDHPAGFDSAADWTDWLAELFDALPGIDAQAEDGPAFSYDPSSAGRSTPN